MTDTGQVPGEGLPADAGAVDQPGAPAPGAYTYLDPAVAPDEDDLLLMPGAQGAWTEGAPTPAHSAPGYSDTGYEQAVAPAESTAYEQAPQGVYAGPDPAQPGPHEASGRDSGSVNVAGVRRTGPAPAAHATPSNGAPSNGSPRRPLHMGPPSSGSGASPVRSLADRGPADATPPQPVRVRQPGPPTVGPEYLDVPTADHGVPQQGQQPGEAPVQDAVPWTPQPQPAQGPHAGGAETVAPDAAQDPAGPQTPQSPEFAAAVPPPLVAQVPAAVLAQEGPYAVAEAPSGPVALPVEVAPQPVVATAPGASTPLPEQPQAEQPVGQFVPVAGQIPSTPHLAPTPPQPLRIPQDGAGRPESAQPEAMQAESGQPEPSVAEEPPAEQPESGAVEATVTAPVEPVAAKQESVPAELPAEFPAEATAEAAPDAVVASDEPVVAAEVPVPEAAVATEAPVDAVPEAPAEAIQAASEGDDAAATVPAPRAGEAEGPAADEHAPDAEAEDEVKTEPVAEPEGVSRAPEQRAPNEPEAPAPVAETEAAQPVTALDPAAVPLDTLAAPEPTPAEAAEDAQATESVPGAEPAQAPDAEHPAEPVEAVQPVEAGELPEPGATAPAPGYDEAERAAVLRVMRERRDIRNGFRGDPIPHEVLLRVLEAAHTAPSVGHSQPWDFVVIRSADTRHTMHELATRQREAYAKSLPKGRAKQFKELKIEAILDTPVNIVVTADPTRGGRHTLGRHTQPQMAPYSSALAVENLWLAARAEGLGVGWVSFFDEREMVRTLGLPEHLEVVAYLCVGYVDAFPDEPELMQAGWSKRRPLSWVVHEETYGRRALPGEEPHDLLAETVSNIRPLDAKALGEAWERQKRMTKPPGALGMLEIISAQLSGLSRMCPPPIPEPAAVAIFAGDHGVHAQGVTPWPQEVTGQMVANFLGGGAVCNAFANQVGAEVCVIDVGVASDLPATPGLLPRKVRAGTADMTTGPALTRDEVKEAMEVGIDTARDLVAAGNKALLTGEMGIGNTTVSAALISVFTGCDPAEVTGRGTGVNDETLARKTDVVRRALELHQPDPADPIGVLAAIGGLEHAALVGLLLGGASLRTPVILDGVSAGAAALVARAIAPEVLAACVAGHRSAEPGHVAALNKLGLRPLVDLDLRLGEGTGALLALPVVQSAARAMHEVATFDSAGVTEK